MRRSKSAALTEKVKSFAGLATKLFAIRENSYRNRASQQTRVSTMKTLLTTCLFSLAFALTSLAQSPAAPQTSQPGAPAMSPAGAAPPNPAAPAQLPATTAAPQQPGAPGATRLGCPGDKGRRSHTHAAIHPCQYLFGKG